MRNRAHRDGEALLPTPSSRDWKDGPGMSDRGVNPDGSERDRTDMLPRRIAALATGRER